MKKKRRSLKKINTASPQVAAYLAMEHYTPYPNQSRVRDMREAWLKLTSKDKADAEQRFLRKRPNADKPRY